MHPDVNQKSIEKAETLWLRGLDAYQSGNLEMLHTLTDVVDNAEKCSIDTEIENAFELVRGKCDRLKERVEKYILKIAEIKNTFPFDRIDFLRDEAQVEERQKDLKDSIVKWNKFYKELEETLENINVS